jgi:SAM-dependent methyltransferase
MSVIPERLVPGTLEWEMFHHEHEQRYRCFADRGAGLDVLDAACGVGYGSKILADSGARSVTAIDVDPEAVAYAQDHFGGPNLTFLQASAEELTALDRQFDLVVSFETIEHLSDPAEFIREVRGVLRPGGRFICSTPNRDFAGKDSGQPNPFHLSEMTFAEFTEVFEEHFQVKEQFHQSHSEAYLRHVQLTGELSRVAKTVRFSKLLALENRMRKWLGKEALNVQPPAGNLGRAVPGDFVIEPLGTPLASHLVFILVGHARD